MITRFHKSFDKQFAKLPARSQERAIAAINLFLDDPVAPSLRNHTLTGEWASYRSISAGGDLRLHLKLLEGGRIVQFVAVGTHSQLYK